MNYHSRRASSPGPSKKRKERDALYSRTPLVSPAAVTSENQPLSSNKLLAGYMAHEFLTKGTLFGHKPETAQPEPVSASSPDLRQKRWCQTQTQAQTTVVAEPNRKLEPHNYADVANLMKSDEVHLPGVVNPGQLASWIQM